MTRRPSSADRLPELRPTYNRLAKILAKAPAWEHRNVLSEIGSTGWDHLYDARFGHFGSKNERWARIGAIHLAYKAYARGGPFEDFEDFFCGWVLARQSRWRQRQSR